MRSKAAPAEGGARFETEKMESASESNLAETDLKSELVSPRYRRNSAGVLGAFFLNGGRFAIRVLQLKVGGGEGLREFFSAHLLHARTLQST